MPRKKQGAPKRVSRCQKLLRRLPMEAAANPFWEGDGLFKFPAATAFIVCNHGPYRGIAARLGVEDGEFLLFVLSDSPQHTLHSRRGEGLPSNFRGRIRLFEANTPEGIITFVTIEPRAGKAPYNVRFVTDRGENRTGGQYDITGTKGAFRITKNGDEIETGSGGP